jgi:hypothetical protein
MTQITLEVPDVLAVLPAKERAILILAGLHEATNARIRQLETEIAESEAHIQRFETRYGVSFARFEAELLPTLDTHQAHEDYNDWFFWEQVRTEKQALLTSLQKITVT